MAVLYVVATPIGNLGDISERALVILKSVQVIAAEDTRHSRRLLDHFGITTRMVACHDHNEAASSDKILDVIRDGGDVALITDAGTPLVSDPGFTLIRAALAADLTVSPVPGASSLLAALSVAGLPVDRFCFEGFLPSKSAGRRARLEQLASETRTLVFFEAPHRIDVFVTDLGDILGTTRLVTLARELTKQYEQVWHGTAGDAAAALTSGEVPARGEFVVVVAGAIDTGVDIEAGKLMEILLEELSPASAASVASKILNQNRKALYEIALSLKKG